MAEAQEEGVSLAFLQRRLGELQAEQQRGLQRGGGGGNSGSMDPWQQSVEARLGDLRSDYRGMASDVSTLKTDVATLKEAVSHLPTKAWIGSTVRNWLAIMVGLATLANIAVTWLTRAR